MKRTAQVGALIAISLLFLNAGCYTVLQHPTGSSVVHEGSQYRTCADCHADADYYHPYSHPYYSYGRSQYGWRDYYGSPWWGNDYWWWDDHNYDGHDHDYDGPEIETGTRHLWSPDGWASGGWGFTKSGAATRRNPPPPAAQPSKKDDKDEDDKKDEEKKEEDRELWKKPKKGF